ncbi:unnamed protein product [Prorocentrum cordatum]|uniref:Protein kinase domain-containing protein n=1 Tax=Prorocentrum cordatum TaxID=2364126 RepID=A0ABN9XP18_9DINO|nr:unnamed protein product [Polarella glacialis]
MGCAANVPATAPEHEKVACQDSAVACQDRATPGQEHLVTHRECPSFHQRYLLGEMIGEGCCACVYSCRRADGGPEGEFAVKVTDLGRFKTNQHAASDCYSRAQREASLLKAMGSQEHCCRLVDCIVDQRFHYLVIGNCSMTLLQALKSVPELTERNMAALVQQMFIAVSEVHALKILHRDLKPDSFLVGQDDTVKLCNFGFARRFPAGPACVRGVFGTAPFMSPEMITGLEYADPTDVWSLGATLYVLLCGEFPYGGPGGCGPRQMKVAIARGVPGPRFAPAVAGAQLSPAAVALLRALLHRDPDVRPSAAEALGYRWFGAAAELAPGSPLPSVGDVLQAAERAGAFERGGGTRGASAPPARSMDRVLQELQREHQRQGVRGSGSSRDDEGGREWCPERPGERAPSGSPQRLGDKRCPCARGLRAREGHRVGMMLTL